MCMKVNNSDFVTEVSVFRFNIRVYEEQCYFNNVGCDCVIVLLFNKGLGLLGQEKK